MTDTLYIIGNGFDLNHGIQTSYHDFKKNYAECKPALWRVLEKLYGNKLDEYLWWSNFEEMLGEVDYEHLADSLNGNGKTVGSFISKDFFAHNLRFFFGDWIKGVDDSINTSNIKKRNDIKSDAYFFSFNYTTLLEKVYHVEDNNVWHIHKSVKDLRSDEHAIIVGHDSNLAQLMRSAENSSVRKELSYSYIDAVNREIEKGAKNVQSIIKQNDFNQYDNIKHYIIMGFSMNEIDIPYIKEIISVNKNIAVADWTIYYHSEKDDIIGDKLMALEINETNIKEPIYW